MQAVERIEIAVRAVITYRLAHDLGPFGYADAANFATTYNHAGLIQALSQEERKSSEVFVQHFRSKYHPEPALPVWMATELMTFGALSRMYANLRTSLRKRVAKEFKTPEPVFTRWIRTVVAIRNIYAHHSRLWNRQLAIKPELPSDWMAEGIGNQRYYVIALVLRNLLAEISPHSHWKERLKAHFNNHHKVDLPAMHFPAGWQAEEDWGTGLGHNSLLNAG